MIFSLQIDLLAFYKLGTIFGLWLIPEDGRMHLHIAGFTTVRGVFIFTAVLRSSEGSNKETITSLKCPSLPIKSSWNHSKKS